jgi:hypothetical protein
VVPSHFKKVLEAISFKELTDRLVQRIRQSTPLKGHLDKEVQAPKAVQSKALSRFVLAEPVNGKNLEGLHFG